MLGNVVPVKPMLENTGYKIVGKTVNKIPTTNAPAIQPFHPPVELPNTPAVPPEKKHICAAGMITIGLLKIIINTIHNNPDIYALKKPSNTAVGAKGKILGQSKAGLEFLIYFSDIDTNSAVISPINKRTPVINVYIPAVNMNA